MAAFVNAEEWQILVSGGVTGLGSGLCFASLANVVVDAAPAQRTGVVAGMNANLRTIGGAIGSAALATLVTSRLLPGGYPAELGYIVGFAGLASAAFLAGLAALWAVPSVPRPPTCAATGTTCRCC
jgi:MFS family permease